MIDKASDFMRFFNHRIRGAWQNRPYAQVAEAHGRGLWASLDPCQPFGADHLNKVRQILLALAAALLNHQQAQTGGYVHRLLDQRPAHPSARGNLGNSDGALAPVAHFVADYAHHRQLACGEMSCQMRREGA